MNDYSDMRSRIRLRGNMLVAWFADATPPVLWRWSTSDVSAGFGLRNQEGRVELVKHEPGVGSSVVAVFANEDRAASALERLSRVLLEQKPQRRGGYVERDGGGFPKWLGVLCAVVLALLLLGWLAVHMFIGFVNNALGVSSQMPPAMPGQAQMQSQQPQHLEPSGFGGLVPGLPGTGDAPQRQGPTAPPIGKPVDVDSLYGK